MPVLVWFDEEGVRQHRTYAEADLLVAIHEWQALQATGAIRPEVVEEAIFASYPATLSDVERREEAARAEARKAQDERETRRWERLRRGRPPGPRPSTAEREEVARMGDSVRHCGDALARGGRSVLPDEPLDEWVEAPIPHSAATNF
jgi:hypothetical protein